MDRVKRELKNQIVNFISNLSDIAPEKDRPKLAIAMLAISNTSDDKIIDFVISKVLPFKKQILDKDEKYFYNCSDSFFEFGEKNVNYIKQLYDSGFISEKDRSIIFVYFENFVSYAEVYLALKKKE